jgi:hypothetical protein
MRRSCVIAEGFAAAARAFCSPIEWRLSAVVGNSDVFLDQSWILLRVLRLLAPCCGATIRLSAFVARTTEA